MNKAIIVSLILAFFFTTANTSVYAMSLPLQGLPLSIAADQNNNNENADTVLPLPVEIPVIVPTATPMPTVTHVQTQPTPTPVVTEENNDDENTNDAEQPNIVPVGGIMPPKDMDSSHKTEDKKDGGEVKDTTTNTFQTTQLEKNVEKPIAVGLPNMEIAKQLVAPIEMLQEIIAPSFASLIKVNGISYYQNERLTQATTNVLLFMSLLLFASGAVLLQPQNLSKAFMKFKEKIKKGKRSNPLSMSRLGTQ